MTLIVLALDALDAGLVNYFSVDKYRLEAHSELKTFAHSRVDPYTLEVWPTVATGLGPEEHGVTGTGTSKWNNPLLELASRVSGHLPEGTRGSLGRFVRESTGQREQLGRTKSETIFDREGCVARNWPGVGDGKDLQYAWDLMGAVSEDMSKQEFERRLLGLCAEQFAWAREMLNHDLRLAGVHIHTLDAAGHAYARDEPSLRRIYDRVGTFVAEVVDHLSDEDELLLLSDHGIRTSFYELDSGEDPASHSWRAYASATTDDLPESVFDVVSWVDRHIEPVSTETEESIEMPVDQLRDLGYIE